MAKVWSWSRGFGLGLDVDLVIWSRQTSLVKTEMVETGNVLMKLAD